MADSGHLNNGFSQNCVPQNIDGEAMTQPSTYLHHTEMSHLSHQQCRNNMVTRPGNFHQNAHIPYCQSLTNQSITSDYNEWNQTVSNQCSTLNHDFYQSVSNPKSTTSDYNEWNQTVSNQSTTPNHDFYQSVSNPESTTSGYNAYESVPNDSPCQSVPNQSTTSSYNNEHQHVKTHEVINIPPIQNDDCNKSEQMAHITLPSSMESSTSSFPNSIKERKCTRFTPEQTAILESAFERDKDPDSCTRSKLATVFQVNERKIYDWFKYRRTKSQKDAEKWMRILGYDYHCIIPTQI